MPRQALLPSFRSKARGPASGRVIVGPAVPDRQRRRLAAGLPRYPGYPSRDSSIAADAEVDLILAGGAVVLSAPLGCASYWAAQQLADLGKVDMLLPENVLIAFGALVSGAGCLLLLLWGLLPGIPLVGPPLVAVSLPVDVISTRVWESPAARLHDQCR